MDLGLKGLRAVKTGGTKGIGRSTANILAAESCRVSVCSRNKDEVMETVSALTKMGVTAYGEVVDVADKAALKKFIADSAKKLGGIDIVVANVSALAVQDEDASWQKAFDVDMMHTVHAVNAALVHYTQSMAYKHAGKPIRFNSVFPGNTYFDGGV